MPYWRHFYHLVWATERRDPTITASIEPFVHRILAARCYELGGQAFAVNGTEDHVHVVAIIPPKIAVAEFVRRLKGGSSRFISLEFDTPFEWQEGYGSLTVGERNLQRAIEYVRRQKEHHLNASTIGPLERMSAGDEGPVILPPDASP